MLCEFYCKVSYIFFQMSNEIDLQLQIYQSYPMPMISNVILYISATV